MKIVIEHDLICTFEKKIECDSAKGLFEQLCEEIPTVLAEEYFKENNRRPEPRKGNLFELWIEDNDFEIWMEEKIEEMWDTLKEEGYAIIGFFNLHNEVLL